MWFKRGQRTSASTYEEAQAQRIAELTKSRRAIADAYEVERQRIERDLHDGTQQYLVAASIKLGEALLDAPPESAELIKTAQHDLNRGLEALRKTVRGIHPQVLAERGLVAAVKDMAAGYGPHVMVAAPHPLPKLSPSVLASGYFFCAEALTNAAKYAPGADVSVLLVADENLHITVVDQGPGGVRMVEGAGLAGMRDRLDAFGGWLEITSPAGGPTSLSARIPLLVERGTPTFTRHDEEGK
ncbi:sensor histidine kinase [Corynebacterium sp. L4756]|uniref:sensor histidine kinase n=1 Tax=unclassified Corynebacterium TaxID=2624378 RepID=UPI00374D3A61